MQTRYAVEGAIYKDEGEGKVGIFNAKRCDNRNGADPMECLTSCHEAQVVGSYQILGPLYLTVLAAESEDYTIAPQHLHEMVFDRPIQG